MTTRPVSIPWKTLPLIFFPAILALGLILYFAVDVPYWDEWDTPLHMYMRIIQGDLDFFDHLFRQHNESRDAFPRLIFLAVGFTIKSEYMYFPINVAVIPSDKGVRFSLLFGFNSRNR